MTIYVLNYDAVVEAENQVEAEARASERKQIPNGVHHVRNIDTLEDVELAHLVAKLAMHERELAEEELELLSANAALALRMRFDDPQNRGLVLVQKQREAVQRAMKQLGVNENAPRRIVPAPKPAPAPVDAETSSRPMSSLARETARAAKANEEAKAKADASDDKPKG